MSDSDRKKRMISLRLCEEDYKALKTQYKTHGARNVSDLARLALQRIMDGLAGPEDTFAAKLAHLEGRVHALESQVSLLMGYGRN
jgi:hypothetical protein